MSFLGVNGGQEEESTLHVDHEGPTATPGGHLLLQRVVTEQEGILDDRALQLLLAQHRSVRALLLFLLLFLFGLKQSERQKQN